MNDKCCESLTKLTAPLRAQLGYSCQDSQSHLEPIKVTSPWVLGLA